MSRKYKAVSSLALADISKHLTELKKKKLIDPEFCANLDSEQIKEITKLNRELGLHRVNMRGHGKNFKKKKRKNNDETTI